MNYKVDHISVSKTKRPGNKMKPITITIHSTGNPNSTARNERGWLTNPSNRNSASWHICVDQQEAIEAIPLNEVAYHSGTQAGNYSSISIEICESGDRTKTLQNAAELTARLQYERGWGIDRLNRHYDWSGKICPRIFSANNWEGWNGFKKQVQRELDKLKSTVKIRYKGKLYEVNGYIQDGRTYVQLRETFEKLGFVVDWDSDKKEVIIK
ncbi:MAG TPA: N-acetylmuramoyl-L-alanine amidase [Clostridiales bacterium]|nr:N-acetylmuramoyl-L-alanine amidase [Clostridiales bacterium]